MTVYTNTEFNRLASQAVDEFAALQPKSKAKRVKYVRWSLVMVGVTTALRAHFTYHADKEALIMRGFVNVAI